MTGLPLSLPGGGSVVPHNRFDLAPPASRLPDVTVVIPYYRGQAALDLVLTALTLSSYPSSRLQVVVADDGSPEPPSMAAAAGLDARVVSQPRQGFRAAAARNLGAAAADGEVVCFLDGDTVPSVDYLTMSTALPVALPDAVVVGRRAHADLTGWDPTRLRAWLGGADAGPPELPAPAWLQQGYEASGDLVCADDRSFRFVISAVLTLRRELFTELGGFDESFTAYGGEDWELGWRAWNAGAVLAHLPVALAWHDGPDWAGRGGDRAAKNAETRALAALIPQRQTRGRGSWQPWPEVVAWLPQVSTSAAVATVECLLGYGDIGVWSTAPPAVDDPRVHHGAPPAGMLARARVRLELTAACTLDVPRLVDRLDPQSVGRVTAADTEGTLAVATLGRAAARARRWQSRLPALDLVAELFGAVELAADEVGVRRLPAEPDLARLWAGW